jgi:DNA repair protein RecO
MYHLHYTPGIIIASRSSGEADRRFRILTRELGVITATAKGVRVLHSKLRYALQTYSHIDLALVRGSGGWRITNAVSIGNIYANLERYPEALGVLMRTLRLIDRMTPGEERHEELFSEVSGGLSYLVAHKESKEVVDAVEQLLLLRVFSLFGYVGNRPDVSVLTGRMWDDAVITATVDRRREVVSTINTALRESHL